MLMVSIKTMCFSFWNWEHSGCRIACFSSGCYKSYTENIHGHYIKPLLQEDYKLVGTDRSRSSWHSVTFVNLCKRLTVKSFLIVLTSSRAFG